MRALIDFFRSNASFGLKAAVAGAMLPALAALPLLVYIVVGPADGNPVGLGLLLVAGVAVGAVLVTAGLLWMVVRHLTGRR